METQIWCLPASSVEVGRVSEKEQWPLPCLCSCLAESCPSSSCPDSVPSYIFLVLLELLPQCWSPEGVGPSKSMCPLRGEPGTPEASSDSATNPAGFKSQKLWGLFFLVLEPWAVGLVWSWGFSFLRWYLSSQNTPPDFFSGTCVCGVSLFP